MKSTKGCGFGRRGSFFPTLEGPGPHILTLDLWGDPAPEIGSMAFSWSVTRSSHHHLGVEIILARWYPWQQNEQTNTMMYGKGGRWRCWHSPMEGEGRRLRGPSPGLQLLPSSVSKPCCKWSWEMWDYVGSGWLLSTCVWGGAVLMLCQKQPRLWLSTMSGLTEWQQGHWIWQTRQVQWVLGEGNLRPMTL